MGQNSVGHAVAENSVASFKPAEIMILIHVSQDVLTQETREAIKSIDRRKG